MATNYLWLKTYDRKHDSKLELTNYTKFAYDLIQTWRLTMTYDLSLTYDLKFSQDFKNYYYDLQKCLFAVKTMKKPKKAICLWRNSDIKADNDLWPIIDLWPKIFSRL